VIKRLDIIVAEGESFMMGFAVVEALPDARHAGNAEGPKTEDICGAHVIDVGGHPAPVEEFPEMGARLVVPAHEEGEIRSGAGARVVVGEVTEMAILDRAGHDAEICGIPHGLDGKN
jgi:hypothetical protein